jgi:hypothetical protein
MAKEIKSREEIVQLVTQDLDLNGLSVSVLWDKLYNWNAFATAVPEGVTDIHVRMQRTVERLRKHCTMEPPQWAAGSAGYITGRR